MINLDDIEVLEPVIIGRTWHYHHFVPAWDARFMRCEFPNCGAVRAKCEHKYEPFGDSAAICPKCEDVSKVGGMSYGYGR